MNIDVDKIECESCGAHLIFTALTSWSPAEGMLSTKFPLCFFMLSYLVFLTMFDARMSLLTVEINQSQGMLQIRELLLALCHTLPFIT